MGCYYTLYHIAYGYYLLFYKVYMKRENAGSWDSGLEKEQILSTYSAQLQKSWNSTKAIFGINKNYCAKEVPEWAHTLATRVGACPPLLGAPPVTPRFNRTLIMHANMYDQDQGLTGRYHNTTLDTN